MEAYVVEFLRIGCNAVVSETKPYDVVDYLHTEEDIQGYLDAVLESGASFKAISKAFMDAERARAKLAGKEPNLQAIEMFMQTFSKPQNRALFAQVAV